MFEPSSGLALTQQLVLILFVSAYRLSVPIACVAATWLVFSAIVVMLPSVYPVTSMSINYAPITVGGAVVLILLAWLITGRYSFHGPRLNVENSDIVHIKYWVTDPPRGACPK